MATVFLLLAFGAYEQRSEGVKEYARMILIFAFAIYGGSILLWIISKMLKVKSTKMCRKMFGQKTNFVNNV